MKPLLYFATLVSLLLSAPTFAANTYEIEEVPLPPELSPEFSGVTFTPSGQLVVVNRKGEVWIRSTETQHWKRFAFGLHEPLGVHAVSDQEIWVTQRPELTRLTDTNQDGSADHYDTLQDDWAVTDNWHEFTFGLPRLRNGDFVLATGLPDVAGPMNTNFPRFPYDLSKVHEEAKPSPGRFLGWAMTVTPEGKMSPLASGFRAGAGVGVSPKNEVFITDQQGDYIATSTLVHVQPGKFYGHPASLKWDPKFKGPVSLEQLTQMRTPEAVALPHGAMGGSPGEPVWDTTHGAFGPFQGQIFIGDFTKLVSRVFLEKVAGEYQGACFPFLRDSVGLEAIQANSGANNLTLPAGREGLRHFKDVPPRSGTPLRPGNMRMAFAPDGSLYLAQTTRGWGQGDGLQRVVWSKKNPVEIKTMELVPNGFKLTFTEDMDPAILANPQAFRMQRFRYLYLPKGSPRVDESPIEVLKAHVSGPREVVLDLASLEPGYIYELDVHDLRSTHGRPVENPQAFYTLTRLLDGRAFTGPMNVALLAPKKRQTTEPDPREGQRIYGTYCVTCHQSDGKGGALPGSPSVGATFVAADFTAQGQEAPLRKTDEALIQIITDGAAGKPMPPFGAVLKPHEIQDVLAYLREAFGKP